MNNETLELDLPVDVSGLQINTDIFKEQLDVDKDLLVFHAMNDDKISATFSHMKEEKYVGVLEVHDEDEVKYAEERVPITSSETLNAINTLRIAVEDHDIGPDYFTTLNNLESTS